MKSEKGFTTILALCLILVIALVVKGIQESAMNHAYEAMDFRSEFELQNAADSGIYEAAEKIRENVERQSHRKLVDFDKIKLVHSGTKTTARGEIISVSVWGTRVNIQGYIRNHSDNSKEEINSPAWPKYGYVLLSVAEMDSGHMNGKIFRRAFAYVVDGIGLNDLYKPDTKPVDPKDENVIHFMELP